MDCLILVSRLIQNPKIQNIYFIKNNDLKFENLSTCGSLFILDILKIVEPETSSKQFYSEKYKMDNLK